MPVNADYYKSLLTKLSKRENLKKVYVFWGKEEYLMDVAVERICTVLSAQKVIVDGSSKNLVEEITSNLQGGLFHVEKVLVVKYVEKPEKVLKFIDLFLKTGGHFIIILRDWKPQQLPKGVETIYFDSLDDGSFRIWLRDKIDKMGKKISEQKFEYLAKRLPRDLKIALNELKKLELISYGQKEIKNGDFEVISDYQDFYVSEVLESILNYEESAPLKFMRVLDNIEQPTYITAGFINYFLKELQSERKRGRLSRGDILRLLLTITRVDAQLKSLPVDKRLLLLELFENLKINVG